MPHLTLKQLQQTLQAYLLDANAEVISTYIETPPHEDTVCARLAIYGNAYQQRLIEALAEDFAGLYQWLGEDSFIALAKDYIQTCPSSVYSLGEYGAHLADFMQSHQTYHQQTAWIEMVQFEWALSQAQLAPNATVLKSSDLAAIAPEAWGGLCLELHPSLQLHFFKSNVAEIWQALKQAEPRVELVMQENASLWGIWRRNNEVYFSSYNEAEAYTLTALHAKQNFARLCTGLADFLSAEDIPNFIALFIQRLMVEEQVISVLST